MARKRPASPLDLMLPYQRRYHDDDARFKAWVASRQIGKSFTSAAEPVVKCAVADEKKTKTTWVALSAGERQALEWLDKAKQWTEAFEVGSAEIREDRDSSQALLKSATIAWPHGSRIIALPANPATARGYSANLVLDEFAFHENPEAIWRAVYPIITNPLRGVLCMRVLSTPNGKGNRFAKICTDPNTKFTVHKTTIHDAIKSGLAINIEELRAGLDDPEAWAQEYECEFLDGAAVLLPYEVIAACESPEASEYANPELWRTDRRNQFPIDLGIDFGRKRDLTVCWAAESVKDLRVTREVLCLSQMSTPQQVEVLSVRIARARRVCLDYTGPGIGLGDYLVKQFGEWNPEAHKFGKIELVTVTSGIKQAIFAHLRGEFDRRNWRIPASISIREDLHSVYRVVTPSGNITYRAPHSEDGHADRCFALALCNRAASIMQGGAIVTMDGVRAGGGRAHQTRFTPARL